MKKTEIILLALMLAAMILEICDIPGGGALLALSSLLLSLLYLFCGFAFFNTIQLRNIFKSASYSGISWKRILFSIATGCVLFLMVMGILFRIQYWAGSAVMLTMGIIPSIFVLVFAIIKAVPAKSIFYPKVIKRLAVFLALGIFLYLLPRSFMLDIRYRNEPETLNRIKLGLPH
jgi:hypothetical protein